MQLFHVLVLTSVAMLMASAILQLVFVIVTLECKDLIVQVNIFGLCTTAKQLHSFKSKIELPTSTRLSLETFELDSTQLGNIQLETFTTKHPKTYIATTISEFICPGNCSNAGSCDTSSGECLCNDGRHDMDCSSNFDSSPQNLREN